MHLPSPSLQRLKGRERGRNADWIAAVGSSLVYRTHRREFFHDVPSAAESGEGKSATEDLAKNRQIGMNLVVFLSTPHRQPKARNHLVKDQKDLVFFSNLSESF